ncbi:MAG: radical SAM family heme chaperone HemW [Lachnospiraceae bacterium]|nr:radical SAM family heme chaperone HemW [Lachnospiraceae bacterium]
MEYKEKKPMGIYVHIPFCVKKCDYCDFVSQTPDSALLVDDYLKALRAELLNAPEKYGFKTEEYETATIYIGGGTPSILEGYMIEDIVGVIRDRYSVKSDAEITIEMNPGTVSEDKLSAYKNAGINRVSIGLQSANDDELKLLSRIHDHGTFLKCFDMVREAGFDNINVDIMTALPGQDEEKLLRTLNAVTALSPSHISAYSLIIEENTPFYERYSKGGSLHDTLPDEESERALYHLAVKQLALFGYDQYEISNFSLKDKYSRHNVSYWKRTPYIGAGLNASSLMGNIRYRNTSDMQKYIADPLSDACFDEKIRLTRDDEMDETMFLGLRMIEGVNAECFKDLYGVSMYEIYGSEIDKLRCLGLLFDDGLSVRMTERGIDYGNYVFSCFLRGQGV